MQDVRKLNPKIKPLPALMTKFVNGSSQSIEMKKIAASEFKAGVFKTTIGYSTVISKSHSNRKAIHEFSNGHRVAKHYDSVALAINRYIAKFKKN
jgi:cellulose biosynthesis protein BcsQ